MQIISQNNLLDNDKLKKRAAGHLAANRKHEFNFLHYIESYLILGELLRQCDFFFLLLQKSTNGCADLKMCCE